MNGKYFKYVIENKLDEFPGGLIVEEFIYGNEYSIGFLGDYPYEHFNISMLDF